MSLEPSDLLTVAGVIAAVYTFGGGIDELKDALSGRSFLRPRTVDLLCRAHVLLASLCWLTIVLLLVPCRFSLYVSTFILGTTSAFIFLNLLVLLLSRAKADTNPFLQRATRDLQGP